VRCSSSSSISFRSLSSFLVGHSSRLFYSMTFIVNKKTRYLTRRDRIIRIKVSISIYLFSRIVSTTTVSSLRGVLFLSLLPLPPRCLFLSFSPFTHFNFSLLPCASASPSLFLFLPLTRILSFPSSRFYTPLRPISISPPFLSCSFSSPLL